MEDKNVSSINLSYEDYPAKSKNKKHYVTKKQYKSIMYLFMKKLVYKLIKTGYKINLPSRLGSLKLYKYDTNRFKRSLKLRDKEYKSVDFNATQKLKERGVNKIVYHTNKVTNGYWWKLKWSKTKDANFKNKGLFALKLSRPNIRPNETNKNNPELSIVPYFRDKGWLQYDELSMNIYNDQD